MSENRYVEKYQGLSDTEVSEKQSEGKINKVQEKTTSSVGAIIAKNIFTYFNLIFAVLAAMLIAVGSYKNLTFLPVIIANVLIGIIQQIRSKKVLDDLSLLYVTNYDTIRNGQLIKVGSEDLVEGDIILLKSGQQIPADAEVLDGQMNVNESLLTGEADEIEKTAGSELKSGSFAVSGDCAARLTKVGAESYASQLTLKAKKAKTKQGEMIRSIEWIIRIAGIAIIPIGAALLYESLKLKGLSIHDSVISMVGAVIGMIPEGLYLLATVALALSAMRLALKKVLLHDMHSTETLARVDVLCVDKTGTITGDDMKVVGVYGDEQYIPVLKKYINTVPDSNSTMLAIRDYFSGNVMRFEGSDVKPFSSAVKYSQITAGGKIYRLGAPEYVVDQAGLSENHDLLDQHEMNGERVLALSSEGRPLLFIAIENEIRKSAPDTFRWFKDRDVSIRVISGDNPVTVSNVARKAGIENADKYCDCTTLKSDADYLSAVEKYTVFGRVKPEQKKYLVRALHAKRHKVAMTGDGVNDILAMKEADCSVAMGSGSEAARQASQVVLLDSDFSKMKDIVGEGRRDVNNITRSATLFLYKNIFSLLLALFSIIIGFKYPLNPSQVSLVSTFNIGIPAFLLALEDNQKRQEGRFIKTTLFGAMPAALTSFFSIAFLVLFGQLFSIPQSEISTASVYLLSLIGFLILGRISRPMSLYHFVVFVICVVGIFVCSKYFYFIFSIDNISLKALALSGVFAIAEIKIMDWFSALFECIQRPKRRSRVS